MPTLAQFEASIANYDCDMASPATSNSTSKPSLERTTAPASVPTEHRRHGKRTSKPTEEKQPYSLVKVSQTDSKPQEAAEYVTPQPKKKTKREIGNSSDSGSVLCSGGSSGGRSSGGGRLGDTLDGSVSSSRPRRHCRSVSQIVVLATSIPSAAKEVLKDFANRFNTQVIEASHYSNAVTHIITETQLANSGYTVAKKRTSKYLLGLLGGQHILSLDWMFNSISDNEILPETNYQVSGDINCPTGKFFRIVAKF
jgi:hypothetical protein